MGPASVAPPSPLVPTESHARVDAATVVNAANVNAVNVNAVKVNKWAVAVAVAIGALLEIIDTSIVNVALTDIQAALGATLSQVSWVVSSYGIANVIILPMSAWLGHRFGKKNYFIFSLVGFTAASVLCGTAGSLPLLVVARVLQGLTGGGLLAKAQSILFETFPREEQAMAQGFFGAIVISGPAIGPTLGGYITTHIGWRWIFFVNVPVGIGAVFLALAALPTDAPKARSKAPVDWAGIALLACGVGSLQTLLEQGNEDDWFASRFIVALAAVAAASLTLFVVRELSVNEPVVDLRVLRYRSLWAGSILSVVIGMALYGALFAIPIFAGSILHYTSQEVGLLLLPGALASAVAMPVGARLAGKIDARVLLTFGALTLVAAMVALTRLTTLTGGDDFFWPLIIRSVGTVFMFLPLQLAALGPVPKKDVAAATGFFNLTRQLGGSIGVALLSTLLEKREAFHRAVLVEKLASNGVLALDRLGAYTQAMVAKGFPLSEAKDKALAMLDGIVNREAAVMSFGDTFWATSALVLATLPLVLLLGRPPQGAKVSAGH
jgi:DHA2 family multidrug resistance protein